MERVNTVWFYVYEIHRIDTCGRLATFPRVLRVGWRS